MNRRGVAAMNDYQSTQNLIDADGMALLDKLGSLFGEIEPRGRSRVQQRESKRAIAELQKALIDAALRFERHQEFTAWLCRNHCEHIEAYDPQRGDECLNEHNADIRDLQHRLTVMEKSFANWRELMMLLVVKELPKYGIRMSSEALKLKEQSQAHMTCRGD